MDNLDQGGRPQNRESGLDWRCIVKAKLGEFASELNVGGGGQGRQKSRNKPSFWLSNCITPVGSTACGEKSRVVF